MLDFLNPTGSNINNLKCINVKFDPFGVEQFMVRMISLFRLNPFGIMLFQNINFRLISIQIKSLRDWGFTKFKIFNFLFYYV